MIVAEWLAPVLFGYLLGAMPVSWLLVRVLTGRDLRLVGSGNVGATNALRIGSWTVAMLVAGIDAAKGAGAVVLAGALAPGDTPAVVAAAAAVVGHVFPCWLAFRGGKGVATAAGAFALVAPVPATLATTVFAAAALMGRVVSVASLAAVGALAIGAWALSSRPVAIGATAVAALIVLRHRENLDRLRTGREPRLGAGVPSGRLQ